MKKATDCGLAAIVLLMLFSLVLTAKDVFLATVPKDKNAALFLCLEIVLGIVIVCLPKIISVKFDLYLPPMIYGFFLLFIFGAIYLGTIYHFFEFLIGTKDSTLSAVLCSQVLRWRFLVRSFQKSSKNFRRVSSVCMRRRLR